jgi:uncharacterized protein
MKYRKSANSEQSQPKPQLICPTCRRPFALSVDAKSSQHRFFPFCSERCKLVDLGAWLDAKYRIPTQPDEESEDALHDGFGDSDAAL